MATRKSTPAVSRPRQSHANPAKVFVGNISYRIKEDELAVFFTKFGPVARSTVVRDHKKGWSRGIGFVVFEQVASAEAALSASEDELILDGRCVRVSTPLKPKREKAMAELLTEQELDTLQTDAPKPDAPQTDAPKPDAPQTDAPQTDAPKLHAPQTDAPKPDAPQTDAPKPDAPQTDSPMPDTPQTDSPKPDAPQTDAPKPDAPQTDAPKPDTPPPHIDDGAFYQLNDDILFHVFTFLTLKEKITMERVCKAWQRTASRWWKQAKSLHFKNIFVSFKGKHGGLTDEMLHSVLKRGCRELRTLDLSSSSQCLTDYSFSLIGMYCVKLEQLDMSRMFVTQFSFKQLVERCKHIKWLNIRACAQIGEKCLWWGLHHLKGLEYLNSARNRRINGQCFYVAGSNLQTVILRECDKLTDVGVAYLTLRSPNLTVLDLSHCQQLTGAAVLSISTNCAALKEFQLSGPNSIATNRDLMGIVQLTRLEVLVLDRLPCKDELLVAMARSCHALRVLSVAACYDVTHTGLESLSCLPELTDLNCSYSNVKSGSWLEAISKVGALQRLVAKACLSVTDQGLTCLARHCLDLRELDISSCYHVTNNALYPFQESLLHMRGRGGGGGGGGEASQFSITVGGTEIAADVALRFAEVTGASLLLQDLSNQTLMPEYPFLCHSMENWDDDDDEPRFIMPDYPPTDHMTAEDDVIGRAEDYLIADDPALFSDDSGPEDWGFQ